MKDPFVKMETYQDEFDFSLELVKKCGEVIKNAFNVEKKISEKSSANDLVTETDQLVEKMLIEGLKERFPDSRFVKFDLEKIISGFFFHRFIGEESVAGGEKCELTKEKTWIIDPIDGTTNFISSNPQMCTILGFMVEKVMLLSFVNISKFCFNRRSSLELCTTLSWTSYGLLGRGWVLSTMERR